MRNPFQPRALAWALLLNIWLPILYCFGQGCPSASIPASYPQQFVAEFAPPPQDTGTLVGPWDLDSQLTRPIQELLSLPLAEAPILRLEQRCGLQALRFERNEGQCDPEAKFLARGPGYHLFLTQTEAVMVLLGTGYSEASAVLRMRMVGANPSPSIRAEADLPGKVNYFIGNDPASWRTNIATCARVRLEKVYPGIDLVYYGNQRELEYDFVLAPGADPNVIQLAFEGPQKVEVNPVGELVLQLANRQVRWCPPHVYQDYEGTRHEVAAAYRLELPSAGALKDPIPHITFQFAAYDRTRPLVLDPVLAYSTFLGGSSDDIAYAVAVDSLGSAYITGSTFSLDFPTLNPIQATPLGEEAAFVTKLNPAGDTILYSTYLGGSGSAAINEGHAIAVDAIGSAVVTGPTASSDFPTMNSLQKTIGGLTDAFVSKLSPDGATLIFSTYLGGEGNDTPNGIALDIATNIYVAGSTRSTRFPTVNPFQGQYGGNGDAFVTKIDPTGTRLIYSTYLGGSAGDVVHGIVVDTAGHAFVVGNTLSTNFPTKNPIQPISGGLIDAFIAMFSTNGLELQYSTYLGGGGSELGSAIALDSTGSAFITGSTSSTNLPTTPSALQPSYVGVASDTYVAKLNPAGSAFVYLTYLGGTAGGLGQAIAADAAGNTYVAGRTGSAAFPTLNPVQGAVGGGGDAFVSKLNPGGSALLWSTLFGGSMFEDLLGLTLDSAGGVYFVGRTASPDFPVQNAAQANYAGQNNDAYVVKIAQESPSPSVQITLSSNMVVIGWPVAAAGFNLEVSDTIVGTPNWLPELTPPIVIGDQNVVTIQVDGAVKFFRLKK